MSFIELIYNVLYIRRKNRKTESDMKRYRTVETEREPISDEEIGRFRPPFTEIVERLGGVPSEPGRGRLRMIRFSIIGAAALLLLLVGGYILFLHERGDEAISDDKLQLAEVLPPEGINPPEPDMLDYEHFVVMPGKKAVFTTKKGSRITVPADAFTHTDGTLCNTPVDLRFIEFHNVKEIFLSGIPMQYDSSGVRYTFESAGMFDIRAFRDSESLVLANGKGITVDLVSQQTDPFNFYYYDTVANQWEYMHTEMVASSAGHGPSAPAVVPKKTRKEQESDQQVTGVPVIAHQEAPSAKILKGQTRYGFKLDYNENDFPELKGLKKDIWFEVEDSVQARKYLSGGTRWDSISLSRSGEGQYAMTLYRFKQSITVLAKAVDYGKGSEATLEEFRLAEASRDSVRRERVQSVLATRNMIMQQEENIMNWASTKGATIYNLGAWNWDKPVPQPLMAMSGTGAFVDQSGKPIVPRMIYLAQKGVNILWNYTPQQDWKYSKARENILWFIMPDGNYGLVSDAAIRRREKTLPVQVVSKEEALTEISKFI
jgi:hypothetical protein